MQVLHLTGQYEIFCRDSLLAGVKETVADMSDWCGGREGIAPRTLVHFKQGIQFGVFRRFQLPTEQENLAAYGTSLPPAYSLAEVTCPVLLYWAPNDWLNQPRSVAAIARQLPNLVDSVGVGGVTLTKDITVCSGAGRKL